jgi:outer membrane receptor protein involved in Fe transport
LWSGIQYAGAQNIEQNKVAGFTDHSLSISKEKKIGFGTLRLSVEALNLGNKNYEIVRNFPMPGRSFRGTLSIHF